MDPRNAHNSPLPPRLFEKVMGALGREARRAAYRRLAWRLVALAATTAGTAVTLWQLAAEARASGFTEYLSLALSDGRAMFDAGGDFASAVLEALPVGHALTATLLLLTMLWSFAAVVREARIIRAH